MGAPGFTLVRWIVLALPFLFLSCQSVEEAEWDRVPGLVSSEEMANTMGLLEELDLLVFSAMTQQNLMQERIAPMLNLSDCPGSVIVRDEKNRRMTIDFGTGCVSERGIEKKGIVTIAYTDSFLAKGSTASIGFENFSLNGQSLKGTRILENLGFQYENKSIRFSSVSSDFQITSLKGVTYMLDHVHIKDLKLSTEERGFRIYLEGYGTIATDLDDEKTFFEIISPVVYLQECMSAGSSIPSQGSLQLKGRGNQQVLLTFNSEDCGGSR